jgi:hypothetical protein
MVSISTSASGDPTLNNTSCAKLVVPKIVESDRLPETGFAPGVATPQNRSSGEQASADYTDMWLEIPRLNVMTPIVGISMSGNTWDVSWLENYADHLVGTVFPTEYGNSAITGHVTLSDGSSGQFAYL